MNHPIINRYLMREITGIFALGLTIFTLVLLMGRMVKLMEMVVSNGLPLGDVIRLIILLLPSFLVLTIPMAFLLAVLLTFGRLSDDNEITVLKASGLSLGTLLPPVLTAAAVAALLTLFISVVAVPWGNAGFKQMTIKVARTYATSAIRERIFRDDLPGIVLYVDHYDESQRAIQRVMIQDSRDPERPLTIFARSGVVSSDDTRGVLQILLENGSIHTRQKDEYRLISFDKYLLTAESGSSPVLVRDEDDMGISELHKGAVSPQLSPQIRLKMLIELHSRFAFPCATFVFAILALPLGLSNRRSGKNSGFTISILVLLVYYVTLSFLRTLAEKGGIPPLLAVWLPNVMFLSLGLLLLRLATQELTLMAGLRRLFSSRREA
jgi:lipopolysaccharide export system permease protein